MKKFPLALFACATALAISPAALIAQSWNFIFTDGTLTASGTFVVSPVALGTYTNGLGSNVVGNNAYVIDSGTITVTGGPLGTIDGSGVLVASPNPPGYLYTDQNPPNSGGANLTIDDVFYPDGNPQLDGQGLLYILSAASTGYAGGITGGIWGNAPGNYGMFQGSYNVYVSGGGSFSAPEGGASLLYLLLGGGACFGAMFFFSRSRFANLA